jgi:hypothetical protein
MQVCANLKATLNAKLAGKLGGLTGAVSFTGDSQLSI